MGQIGLGSNPLTLVYIIVLAVSFFLRSFTLNGELKLKKEVTMKKTNLIQKIKMLSLLSITHVMGTIGVSGVAGALFT